jgi:hypothetical protein
MSHPANPCDKPWVGFAQSREHIPIQRGQIRQLQKSNLTLTVDAATQELILHPVCRLRLQSSLQTAAHHEMPKARCHECPEALSM